MFDRPSVFDPLRQIWDGLEFSFNFSIRPHRDDEDPEMKICPPNRFFVYTFHCIIFFCHTEIFASISLFILAF